MIALSHQGWTAILTTGCTVENVSSFLDQLRYTAEVYHFAFSLQLIPKDEDNTDAKELADY